MEKSKVEFGDNSSILCSGDIWKLLFIFLFISDMFLLLSISIKFSFKYKKITTLFKTTFVEF